DVQRTEPPAHGVCGGSVRYPRSPAGGAGALTPRPRALDMALPHRSFQPARRGVELPAAFRGAIRCRHLLVACIHAAVAHSAISLLSVHRSAFREEQGLGAGIRSESL